jgi:hypothetical protein
MVLSGFALHDSLDAINSLAFLHGFFSSLIFEPDRSDELFPYLAVNQRAEPT